MSWNSFWQSTWDNITPWDTANEKKEKEQPYKDTFNSAADKLNSLKPDIPIYDDQGRITGYKNADTGEIDRDYSSLWNQLDTAKAQGIPTLNDWMSQQGYQMNDPMAKDANGNYQNQSMQGLQDLINQFKNGPSTAEQNQATNYAEQTMGMAPGTYSQVMGGLMDAANKPISDFQGMSDQERAVRERANRNEAREMEERATRMIDNITASSGSVARSYAAADQAVSQINDVQLQQQMAIYDDDYKRKTAESDKAMQRYQLAVQSGQMSKAQYLDILQKSKSMAFQGYATQINTMMQQNQQYLQMYQGDTQAIEANINNIYKAINAEIGIDDKSMKDMQDMYQIQMAPLLQQMDIASQQLDMAKADESTFNLGQFLLGAGEVIGGVALTLGTGGLGGTIGAGLVTAGAGTVGSSF